MTLEGDDGYKQDADGAWTPAIDGMTRGTEIEIGTDTTDEMDSRTETHTGSETADSAHTSSEDTPRSEWTTASGERLPQAQEQQPTDQHHSHHQARNWSFGVVRVLRVLVGMVAFFILLFNIDGAFHRVLSHPGLMVMTLAVISQFVQVEDIQRVKSLLGR